MEYEILPRIDEVKLDALMRKAQETGDCSSPVLGEMIRNITKKLTYDPEFIACTDDWKLEMIGAANLNCCKAILKYDSEKCVSPVNYMITIAKNSFRRAKKFLKNKETLILDGGLPIDEDFFVRNKRRILQQARVKATIKDEKEIVKSTRVNKQYNIRRVVALQLKKFNDVLNDGKLLELVQLARKQREAANG